MIIIVEIIIDLNFECRVRHLQFLLGKLKFRLIIIISYVYIYMINRF